VKKLLTLLAVAAIAGTALAGGISGRVVNARTGDPVEGAVVVAQGRNDAGRATTNARGVYEIDDLEPGDYAVTARARGFETARYPRPVTVARGITTDINFRLVPSGGGRERGFITGRVVDARTGDPIEGAVVMAMADPGQGEDGVAAMSSDGEDGRRGMFRAVTNARGQYRIPVRPGVYKILAKARGYKPARFPREVGVRPGQTVEGVSFRLEPVGQHKKGAILGKVYDARTREPIAGAVVIARSANGREVFRARTNRRGLYKIVADPGAYRVVAMARGYSRASYPRPVPVRVGHPTEGIDFGLRRIRTDLD
jgi:protocatechuate 3,4-dioxygenase beta subunit